MGLLDTLTAQTPQGEQIRSGLLGLGMGLLGGSTGHYGQFAPALAMGLGGMQRGMQDTRENQMREQQLAQAQAFRDLQARQLQGEIAQQEGFRNFFTGGGSGGAQSFPAGQASGNAAGALNDRIQQAINSGNPALMDWGFKAQSAFAQNNKPTTLMQNIAAAGLRPGTPEYQQAVLAGTRNGTTVNVGAGEKSFDVESGKLFAKRYDDIATQANSANSMLGLLDLAQVGLDSGVRTGSMGSAEQSVRQLGAALGVGDADKLAGGELLAAVSNRMALMMRSPDSGMGMPGAVSDRDLSFLKEANIGLDRSPAGNEAMLGAFRKLEQRKLDIAELADQYVQANGRLDAGFNQEVRKYANENPMFGGEKQDARSVSRTGRTADGRRVVQYSDGTIEYAE